MHTKLTVAAILLIGICACQKRAENSTSSDSMNQPVARHDSSNGMMAHSGMMDHDAMVKQMESMDGMMVKDLGEGDSAYDLRFIDLMIPHHEGAVMMAKDALSKAKHPELKKLCEDIIRSQNKEIDEMKQWRKSWYNR
jgi:uncharacterized protein (DUF305 family)